MSAFDHINRCYGLAVKRGSRVRYTGDHVARIDGSRSRLERFGTVTGTRNSHLLIRMDGERSSQPYHPTWEFEVLADG